MNDDIRLARPKIVTSGEEESSSEEEGGDEMYQRNNNHPDELFDDQADDEDEAYVYKNLRSGTEETVQVVNGDTTRNLRVLKPRNSDAVLSCPCCFNIVCMDCQRHERFANQFRAMFVMGISVDWNEKLRYDDARGGLVIAQDDTETSHRVPLEAEDHAKLEENEVYYNVRCANCQTQVAALDMKDEVYHFFGCLESS
jgi:hypothetical protein